MSKKNNNRPRIINSEFNEVENIEAAKPIPVEEKPIIEEKIIMPEEVIERIPVPPVVEEPVIQDEVVIEKPVEVIPEPMEKEEEKIYVTLGLVPEKKLQIVNDRLDRAGFKPIILKTGEIIVGPFKTETDAIFAKKAVLKSGLKGKITQE